MTQILHRSNVFRSELQMHIESSCKNQDVHLLFHSATLPMVIGLAEWLQNLPVNNAPNKLGLHFQVEPYYGNVPLESTQRLVAETLRKIYTCMEKIKGGLVLSAQNPTISNEWNRYFHGNIKNCPTPTIVSNVHRQRQMSLTRLLFVGNLRKEKNINLLLQSIKPLLYHLQNLEIKIVYSSRDLTIKSSDSAPIERLEIIQSDCINDNDYYQEIVDADIVWCLYDKNRYSTRSSNIFWEAQALGVPCLISTQTGAHDDYLKCQCESAILMEGDTIQQLYDACKKAITNIDYYKKEAVKVKQYYLDLLSGKEWHKVHFK